VVVPKNLDQVMRNYPPNPVAGLARRRIRAT